MIQELKKSKQENLTCPDEEIERLNNPDEESRKIATSQSSHHNIIYIQLYRKEA